MKILKNEFSIETETWSDPGDYPSAAGSGPLPSYDYVCGISGELIIHCDSIAEIRSFEEDSSGFANTHADIPDGVKVTRWNLERQPTENGSVNMVFTVEDFNADRWEPPQPDYDHFYNNYRE